MSTKLTVEDWCEQNDIEYFDEGWNSGQMETYAEAYHKAEVESLLEKHQTSVSHGAFNFIRDLKQQLLKDK